MIYTDRRYLLLISSRLERFKQTNEDTYNFRCPYCGDSKKNQSKARGYVYRRGDDYFYICHNCNVSTTFGKLLESVDTEQYKEYVLDKYLRDRNVVKVQAPVEFLNKGPKAEDKFKHILDFKPHSILFLPDGHYAKEYIRNRKIPQKFWDEMFFVESYKDWMDAYFPNHGKEHLPADPRIVLFYTNGDGVVTNVTGRALAAEEKLRYVTVKILDQKKVFNLWQVNTAERVYITEGQFDSMFLPNAVASGDANLNGLADYMRREQGAEDLVLIWDNTPRNRDVVKQIGVAIESGYKVVLLPYDPESKDINEMVKNGMSVEEIKELIDKHTYYSLGATLKWNEWRKC